MRALDDPLARLDSLLPRPARVEATGEVTVLPERPNLAGPAAWVRTACRLLDAVGAVPVAGDVPPEFLLVEDPARPAASYLLEVTPLGIELAASDEAGLLNGLQTLRQLLDPAFTLPAAAPDTGRELACCTIEDAARYAWRGAMIDTARHFPPLRWLFSFVDTLAAHKLNVLHLHLNDDQGWRFEVPAYPRLTEVGGHRPGTRRPTEEAHDGVPVGGYYTQAQLNALVAYAAQRGITIVPEIDVPGHVRALLAAYPEYGWGDGQPIATEFGIFPEILWPDDRALRLVEDIFTDLLAVFPSEVIHIGGDEVPRAQWRGNPDADALAASRGLDSVEQLQRWFTLHLRDWMAARGRRIVGWDEILADGDVEDAVVMSWQGDEPGRRALASGHDVVMAPAPLLYFDYDQSDSPEDPYGHGPVRTWQEVVAYDPAAGVAEADLPRLLGVQGQAWAEFMPTTDHVEYMVWPRLACLAEIAWHGPADPDAFEPILRAHLERLDMLGVNYRPLDGPRPWQAGGTGRRAHVEWDYPPPLSETEEPASR